MDGEVRVNKNEGGSADHVKGHNEISHSQETVSSFYSSASMGAQSLN